MVTFSSNQKVIEAVKIEEENLRVKKASDGKSCQVER